jgi:RNA polymerase sigma factor (sigma-70 family)
VRAYKDVGAVRDSDKLPAWLMRIAQREADRHLGRCIKEQRYKVPIEEVQTLHEAEIARPDMLFEAAQKVNYWLELAESISPEFSKILELHLVEEFDLPDIAELMHMPYEKIRRIYYRGLQRLKKMRTDNKA